MLAVLDDPAGTGPARVIGMGCDVDPVAAVDKAVFEACQARPSEAARSGRSDHAERLQTYEDVRGLDDHPAFHALRRNMAEFDFLDLGASASLDDLPRPETADPAAVLDHVVDGLVRAGARVAYVDITGADIVATRIRVVRCIATGFQPIHFGHGEGRLGSRRLFEAPVAWGLRRYRPGRGRSQPLPSSPGLTVMLPVDDPMQLSRLFHLNSEPWLNEQAYRGAPFAQEFKDHLDAPRIPLPPPAPGSVVALAAARYSVRAFEHRAMSGQMLSDLLHAAYGIVDRAALEGDMPFSGAGFPSAGGLIRSNPIC